MTNLAPETQASPHHLLDERSSGVLLHISSLPSRYGIGDMGSAAYRFADQMVEAGQKYWQILPLNPSNSSAGESPYFSSSAFAGNPLLIDLDALVEEGLISESDIEIPEALPEDNVDFERVRPFKLAALDLASDAFLRQSDRSEFNAFCLEHASWLEDFALFTALKQQHGDASWADWPVALRNREPAAIAQAQESLASQILREQVLQFFFFRQWMQLKNYCNQKGLIMFGDMPIYVSYESSDVWGNAEIFKLDDEKRPTMVSGVPPDYFSATGQLWNNPVYNWDALRAQNYQWWIDRMAGLFNLYNIVRIDHFRGLLQYWEVPAGSETAIDGTWQDVPSYEFFDALIAAHPDFPVVVEDLGIITPDVVELKDHYNFPGMLVLHFAFSDEGDGNPYLPQNHPENALVYLGSHDNTTSRAWFEDEIDDQTKSKLFNYAEAAEGPQMVRNLVEMALSSRAKIAVLTAQDMLALPARARMNEPSTPNGNWVWRLTEEEFNKLPMDELQALTAKHHRQRIDH